MNLSRFDHLLEQANAISSPGARILKTVEELTELSLSLQHHIQRGGDLGHVAEEMADALLTIRGSMLLLELEEEVPKNLEAKAARLHGRILAGEVLV